MHGWNAEIRARERQKPRVELTASRWKDSIRTAVLQLEERELVRSEIGKITACNFQVATERAGALVTFP
jgi:hypothetical protein